MEDETKEFARYKTVNEKEVLKEPVKQFINTQIYCCFLCVDEFTDSFNTSFLFTVMYISRELFHFVLHLHIIRLGYGAI